ncbi:MAG: PspC domain-containing protein [Firmicutes bacterium]|nr:PspC domain-containing protein [Bacillota bacterium]
MSNVKRLLRSRRDKKLGGVCAGLAEYFDLDVSLVRLAWIFFAVLGGSGVLAYILAWIVIPE